MTTAQYIAAARKMLDKYVPHDMTISGENTNEPGYLYRLVECMSEDNAERWLTHIMATLIGYYKAALSDLNAIVAAESSHGG